MNKYKVSLADNYTSSLPFTTGWNYELLGDKLRAEFDEWFAQKEKDAGAGLGKTKQLIRGDYIGRFMIMKRVNLVDDPATGSLKSVFVLRKGEEKIVDERAKESLAKRFEYKVRKAKGDSAPDPSGFMNFELVEGSEDKSNKKGSDWQIDGNDIEYFNEEEQEKEVKKEKKEEFACEECGKSFSSKRALHAHSLSHKD